MTSTTISDETQTLMAPSIHLGVDRLTRLAELTIQLHMIRAKATSYERRLNEMLTLALNDGADPHDIHEATGVTYDEMLIAERNSFRALLGDDARLRLLGLVGEVPQFGELGDGSGLHDSGREAGLLRTR